MAGIDELSKHAKELEGVTGISVRVIQEPGTTRIFVLLSQVPLPVGVLKVNRTDVLFIADQLYPLSAMDMFWTEVEVVRSDGSIPQGAESIEQYLGRTWRRFSWHRNGIWNPTGNPVLDHFAFMESRLAVEARR